MRWPRPDNSTEARGNRAAYRNARAALEANGRRDQRRGISDETPKFARLNHAVHVAEQNVPWWRR